MNERYAKSGRTFRIEIDARQKTAFRIEESGIAVLEKQHFRCFPAEDTAEISPPPHEELEAVVESVQLMVRGPLTIERLVAISGLSAHEFRAGQEHNRWNETAARLHVSVAHRGKGLRLLLDIGSSKPPDLDFSEFSEPLEALNAIAPALKPTRCSTLRLRPAVAAALWPALMENQPAGQALDFVQKTSEIMPFDGKGRHVVEGSLSRFRRSAEWPNFFRPSYRVRPLRAPLGIDLHLPHKSTANEVFDALALLAPCRTSDDSIRADLLCRDPQGRSFAATAVMKSETWKAAIAGTGEQARWYPFSGGSFGRETELANVELMPWMGL
jgi:hypothetical protein